MSRKTPKSSPQTTTNGQNGIVGGTNDPNNAAIIPGDTYRLLELRALCYWLIDSGMDSGRVKNAPVAAIGFWIKDELEAGWSPPEPDEIAATAKGKRA